jgi:5-methylthioribose kinase
VLICKALIPASGCAAAPAFCCCAQGPSGGVCLKQALPFVRCVGEGWPLSQDRARIEAEALQLEHKLCPQHTPEVGVKSCGSTAAV